MGKIAVYTNRQWIACLYTSNGYGRKNMRSNNPGKDSEDSILQNTAYALEGLRTDLELCQPRALSNIPTEFDDRIIWSTIPGQIVACKFNSGAFGVAWEKTRALIIREFEHSEMPWLIVDKCAEGIERPLGPAGPGVSKAKINETKGSTADKSEV
jgi:hypothetical protein